MQEDLINLYVCNNLKIKKMCYSYVKNILPLYFRPGPGGSVKAYMVFILLLLILD